MASSPLVSNISDPSSKGVIALGEIPTVGRLFELLGLNIAPLDVKIAFRNIAIKWRKSRKATELLDWHCQFVQEDLRTLAENFLADKDNAQSFWSANRPWKYDSTLQYPEHKDRIIDLLVQLFFKQNRYKKGNDIYHGRLNHKDGESESSREGSTPHRMTSTSTAPGKDSKKSQQQKTQPEATPNTLSNFIDLSEIYNNSLQLHRPLKHGRHEPSGEARPPNKKTKYPVRASSRTSTSEQNGNKARPSGADPLEETSPFIPPPRALPIKPLPKAPIPISFSIITRSPRETYFIWLDGKIQGVSLSDFISGVAKATNRISTSIQRLELILKTTTSNTKVSIGKSDENAWLPIKKRFTQRLKEARAKAAEIDIEPFFEEMDRVDQVRQDEDEVDDEEFGIL